MWSQENRNVWIEKNDGNVKSIVRLVHLLSETMATMLKSTALVAYPVRAILLNASATRIERFIGPYIRW